MDYQTIDKLVRDCVYQSICTSTFPPELVHKFLELMHPPIRDLIILFIENAESILASKVKQIKQNL